MDQHLLLLLVSATLVASPVLAVLSALLLRRHLRAVPGEGRRWIPALPERPQTTGRPARRFEAAVRKAEKQAVKHLLFTSREATIAGIEAGELAVQLGVPPEVTGALLDDWRARLPCRLRVTRGGRLLHDLPRSAVADAVTSGWHAWPQRLLLFGAAIIANIGATWWLIVGVVSSMVSLSLVWEAEDIENRIFAAIGGVITLSVIFGLAQFGALLVRGILALFRPRMALARRDSEGRATSDDDEDRSEDGGPAMGSNARRSNNFDLSNIDLDSGGCGAVVLMVCVAMLCTAVVGGLTIVFVWLRGLWRTARRFGEPEVHLSPAEWLGQARRASTLERWLPTNDLAVRMVRALNRALTGRPVDGGLSARILARARRQKGRIAAIEVALDEGLSPADALTVLARLIGRHGGDLQVSDTGEIDAVFDDAVARGDASVISRRRRRLEYLPQLAKQPEDYDRAGVNLPGLTRDHLDAASRLAGGPLITLIAMLVGLVFAPGEMSAPAEELGLLALFCVLVPGTLMLTVATRAAVAETARQGVLRDVRHAAVRAVKQQLNAEAKDAAPPPLWPDYVAREIRASLRRLVPGWGQAEIQLEVEATWNDLGIGTQQAADTVAKRWEVRQLAARLDSLKTLRARPSRPHAVARSRATDDVVIFDSAS